MAKVKTYTYWISYRLPDEGESVDLPFDTFRKKTRRELKKFIEKWSTKTNVFSRPRKVVLRYFDIISLLDNIGFCGLEEPWDDVEWKLYEFWKEGFETSELAEKV